MRTRTICSLLALLPALALMADRRAYADDGATRECVDAYVRGQRARSHGKLVAARTDFLRCAQSDCPGVTTRDCNAWRDELEARIPSVVFRAFDHDGRERFDVTVSADDAPLLPSLDGHAVSVDPGKHTFRLAWTGDRPVDREMVVVEGVKAQLLEAHAPLAPFPSAAVPAPAKPAVPGASPSAGIPASVWALGGVGVGAAGAFSVLGGLGFQQESALRTQCNISCSADYVDSSKSSIRLKYALADASLATSLVVVGVAAVLYLTRSRPDARVPPGAAGFDVERVAAVGTYGWRF